MASPSSPKVIPLVVAQTQTPTQDPNGPSYELFECLETTDVSSQKTCFSLMRRQISHNHLVSSDLNKYLLPFSVSRSGSHFNSDRGYPAHMRNIVVIDSTKSGVYASSSVYFTLVKPLLEEFGLSHVYVSTSSESTIKNHAKSFSSSATVIFLSGDTSVHEFINHLPETISDRCLLHLAIIPTGTGNALSTSIGHTSIAHALSRFFLGSPEPLSTMTVEFPIGTKTERQNSSSSPALPHTQNNNRKGQTQIQSVVVASTAFHAAIVADSDTPELRKFGSERFKLAARKNLEESRSYYAKISHVAAGNNLVTHPVEEHAYLMFTLVKFLEKGYCISPNTQSPTSQSVYMVDMESMDSRDLGKILMSVYTDRDYYRDSRVKYLELAGPEGAYARVLLKPGQDPAYYRWCIDGKTVVANVTEQDREIVIYKPSHVFQGWRLMVIV